MRSLAKPMYKSLLLVCTSVNRSERLAGGATWHTLRQLTWKPVQNGWMLVGTSVTQSEQTGGASYQQVCGEGAMKFCFVLPCCAKVRVMTDPPVGTNPLAGTNPSVACSTAPTIRKAIEVRTIQRGVKIHIQLPDDKSITSICVMKRIWKIISISYTHIYQQCVKIDGRRSADKSIKSGCIYYEPPMISRFD